MVAITGSVAQLSEPTSTSGSVDTYSTRKRLQVARVEDDPTSGAAAEASYGGHGKPPSR